MPVLTLGEQDARIVALAVAYHLGRPGSETDPDTLRRHDLGLGPVQAALAPQAGRAQATLALTPYQLHRLGEALLGLINELKQYELAQRRSAVPAFEATLTRLFPALAPDASGEDSALDLVTHVVLLRRRLAAAVAEAAVALAAERAAATESARAGRPHWWQRWRARLSSRR
ncbi:MAG: hypothetical protein EXR68_06780 [Dehalococcoidia bacterium]|nr:hypothetical protein [Dehalococcoidia bacterium]